MRMDPSAAMVLLSASFPLSVLELKPRTEFTTVLRSLPSEAPKMCSVHLLSALQ